jgi:phosphotransacetylase
MADPALVVDPTAVELAEITLATAATVRAMGTEPVCDAIVLDREARSTNG